MESFLYLLLAIFGLGFLVFIHELGHYFMALKVGMRVEAFGIGFGRAIYSWKAPSGVEWRINWLPFGGYVQIAGMEKENGIEPGDIPDGFFGKSPLERIQVAFMGPFVNLTFALIAFTLLWGMGGREKNFGEFSTRIGWIDPQSELYQEAGVRPGDIITKYDGREVSGFKDHLYASMMNDGDIDVEGFRVDYDTGEKTPFKQTITPYPHPAISNKEILTTGIVTSASYVFYPDQGPDGLPVELPEGSPMEGSGVQPGDRVVWADGEKIFSTMQLQEVLNDERILVTVERAGKTAVLKLPRIAVEELRLDREVYDEMIDWQYEADLRETKLGKLFFLPYNIRPNCTVEGPLRFIDAEVEENYRAAGFPELEPGDKILAVDGHRVTRAYQFMERIQQRQVHLIVARVNGDGDKVLWTEADKQFDAEIEWDKISLLANTIGTPEELSSLGNLKLLSPVTPKTQLDFARSPEEQKKLEKEVARRRGLLEQISDPETRTAALASFDEAQETLLVGLPLSDRKVIYNPGPLSLFYTIYDETVTTLQALLSGYLSPKWLAGPVGIVQVIQTQSRGSLLEALFWLGAISMNLGMLNLLPIPVLDGGHICISIWEMVTGKKLSSKTMERLIIPFAVLLIGFLIFITYHDLSRLFLGA